MLYILIGMSLFTTLFMINTYIRKHNFRLFYLTPLLWVVNELAFSICVVLRSNGGLNITKVFLNSWSLLIHVLGIICVLLFMYSIPNSEIIQDIDNINEKVRGQA